MKKFFISLVGVSLLFSCGRKTDFVYHVASDKTRPYQAVHKLKELQGDPRVDILWVVDNSGSMGMYQKALADNTGLFIDEFVSKSKLDWKMGLISTDPVNPPYIGLTSTTELNSKTLRSTDLFKEAIGRLGTGGSVRERFYEPVIKAFNENPSFLRPDVTLAMIILTDSIEQSRITTQDFLKFVDDKKKGSKKKTIVYGIFGALDLGCTRVDDGAVYKGSIYEEVVTATQGKHYSLCQGDFGTELAKLGADLVSRVQRPFIQLKDRPKLGSIKVIYKGKPLTPGLPERGGMWVYDYDLNRIFFNSLDFAPGDQEQVDVTYEEVI